MDAGSPFERILDAKLAATGAIPSTPPVVDARPDPGLWFAMGGGGAGTAFRCASAGLGNRYRLVWPVPDGRQRVAEPRSAQPAERRSAAPAARPRDQAAAGPRRVLLRAERDALAWLRQCGEADLPDDFTPEELKRAYRRLAWRYHPDRHVGADQAVRTALAVTFHRIHDAHRLLSLAPVQAS
jgi:hypothetical protein